MKKSFNSQIFSSDTSFNNYCIEISKRIAERKKREEIRKKELKTLSPLSAGKRERLRLKALTDIELLLMAN